MLPNRPRIAIALVAALMFVAGPALSGCGRSPIDPLAAGDTPGVVEPNPGEGEYPEEPFDPGNGGGFIPAPGGGSTGGGPAPAAPGKAAPQKSGLKPISRPTPTPAPGKDGGGGADPEKARTEFVSLLENFGYDAGSVHNIRMQIQPLLHVPFERYKWIQGEAFDKRFEFHTVTPKKWPFAIGKEQWAADGIALARRDQNFSFYVARRALYRSILANRYSDTGSDSELIFYKRLNRTGFLVSYRADGTVDDYGYFPEINWREFIAVPAAYLQ